MEDYPSALAPGYERSAAVFAGLVAALEGPEGRVLDHGHLERLLDERGRELLRCLFQDHLDQRAALERASRAAVSQVVGADGVERCRVEAGRSRGLASIFGKVRVERLVYRLPGRGGLRPAEAVLNLPPVVFSAGVARLLCRFAAAGSFDAAIGAVADRCGVSVGKGAAEQVAAAAVADWEDFYAQAPAAGAEPGQAVVITADGKGIVMRSEYRREAGGRKKMAELACVYTCDPVRRDPDRVLGPGAMAGPVAENKRLFASVTDSVASVIGAAFDEADARDVDRHCRRVVLVDGNRHQIDCVEAEAAERALTVHIVLDVIPTCSNTSGRLRECSAARPVRPPRRGWPTE